MVEVASFELQADMHVHLVGIGGSGISAIARVLAERGYSVSGSDRAESKFSAELPKLGVKLYHGHAANYVSDADVIVISSAIPSNNPEIIAARQAGIPVLKRSDFLSHLMAGQVGIAIAGTHGKTTTTSMIAQILIDAGLDPTVIVGGILPSINTNARAGKGHYFVIEADEYDHMFLGLDYKIAVINNIEHDHPDIFVDDTAYKDAFHRFAAQVPKDGTLYVNGDDSIAANIHPNAVTVGLGKSTNIRATNIQPNNVGGSDFVAMEGNALLGIVRLRVPGEHNVRNAMMALSVAYKLDVDFQTIRRSLGEFGGVGRRFQTIGAIGGVTVVDDYAHHPTEIEVTLSAARQRFADRIIWAVWQPHTYSRTKLYFDKFTRAFDDGSKVIVLDIFRSRERDTLGIDSEQIVAAMQHPYVRYIGAIEDAAAYILDRIGATDVVLTLGAGDGNLVGALVLDGLDKRVNKSRALG